MGAELGFHHLQVSLSGATKRVAWEVSFNFSKSEGEGEHVWVLEGLESQYMCVLL